MKFTCEKPLLLSAILTASRAAVAKSPIPLLEGLLLEVENDNVRITGFNQKIYIVTNVPAEVEKPGEIVINARLLSDIVRKMPGQYVTVSVGSEYRAQISSEMSNFEVLGFPTSDYATLPKIDEQDTIEIGEAILKKMISQTIFAVSDNESRPIHTGALFETGNGELTVVAVDGYRLALRREPLESDDNSEHSFVVPGDALAEVERIVTDSEGQVTIKFDSKHIIFNMGDTILISLRLEGDFLNYKNSLPQQANYKLKVEKDELIEAAERVSLIINDKLKRPVRCVFSKDVIELNSESALGKAYDECQMVGNGDNLEIGFNNRYLIEALKAAPSDDVMLELNSGVTPCIISPANDENNFLYMILPMRLKTYEG